MAEESITRDSLSAILKLVKSSEDTDFLKETCEWAVNQLLNAVRRLVEGIVAVL
jgi:hypothetical protein